MVSPRTPSKQRYGPTGGGSGGGSVGSGGGRRANGGAREDLLRRRVGRRGLGLGVDGAGTSDTCNFCQNNGSGSDGEWDGVHEVMGDDVLVARAREAIERAERSGHGMFELEEREWEAWQRHEAVEEEIERRVAERLEAEKRRKIAVPVPARPGGISTSGPGILTEEGFALIGGSPLPMSSQIPSQSSSSMPNYPDSTDDNFTLDTTTTTKATKTPPRSPPLAGAFPGSPKSESLSLPVRSIRHVSPVSLPHSSIRPVKNYLSSSAGTSSLGSERELPPQPGSLYHPGKHPSLSSTPDLDLSGPESSDGDVASVRSTTSSLSEAARIRRQRREELRAELRRR